jgi:hypothetical protein
MGARNSTATGRFESGPMSECIECGCTDEQACLGGCHWLVQFDDGTGICSSCPEAYEEWQANRFSDDLDWQDGERPSGLILPGDPEYDATLAHRR